MAKKSTKAAPKAYQRMEAGAKAPPGLSPAERKAWIEAASGGGSNSWKPSKLGEFVKGKIVSIQTRKSQFGPTRVLSIDQGKGGVVDVWCGSVLEREMERVDPKVGRTVLIIYKGEAAGKKGRPARLFGLSLIK